MCDRIVVLVDMDCFYCQVETRLNPSLKGKPVAVVQYNQWRGGGIIAVNYEARKFGVTRHLRGDEARQKCPDIALIHVPAERGKADLTKYRDAGREVVNVLCQFSDCVERASVDEAYIDITNAVEQRLQGGVEEVTPSQILHTFVVGLSDTDNNDEEIRSQCVQSWLASIQELQDTVQLKLAIGAALVEEMRAAVYSQTSFECSAGIAHNKILSKLACGLHKPNRQTVLPQNGVNILYQTLPVKKIRSLGGKFGDLVVDQLGCTVMADLAKFSEKQLQQKFDEKTGTWLFNIARGIDNDRVTQRLVSKSIGCCKKFPGKQALGMKEDVEKWLHELALEVSDRLIKDLKENKRSASQLTVSYSQDVDGQPVSSSRSGALSSYEPQKIVDEALELMKKSNATPTTLHWTPPLKYLGISVGKFSSLVQAPKIDTFFKNVGKKSEIDEPPNVTADTRNKTLGSSKEIVERQETNGSCIGDKFDEDLDNMRPKKNLSSLFLKNKTTESGVRNAKICSETLSNTISKSKQKILANMPKDSKNRSFFLNYLRTKNLRLSASRSEDLLFTKVKGDDNIAKSSDLEAETKAVDQILFAPSTSNNNKTNEENETGQCINVNEIFPNLSQADSDIVELLPTQMREQINARKLVKLKEAEAESTRSELPSVKCSDDDVFACSSDSSLSGNRKPTTGVSVVVDVHRSVVPAESCVPSPACSPLRTENTSRNTNPSLLSSLQQDENVNVNKRYQLKRLSQSEVPFTYVDSCKNDSQGLGINCASNKKLCNNVVLHGNGVQFVDKKNNLKTNSDTFSAICVRKNEACGTFPHSSSVENVYNPANTGGTSSTSILEELCCECKKMIPLKDFPEHLDFHVAENLQRELNSEQMPCPVVRKSPVKQIKKRGRPGKKQGNVMNVDKKMRSITTFFTPR